MKWCILILWSVLLIQSTTLFSQEPFKARSSPLAMTQVRYKDAYIKITYSQPLKRGREIFGKLVPYDQVWRTGANEATELTTTKDLMIINTLLKAGTYSIFTIPNEDHWTIIINSDVGLWGSYNYSSKLDVMRFDVPVRKITTTYEAFTMILDPKNELADLLIRWDTIEVTIPVKFLN